MTFVPDRPAGPPAWRIALTVPGGLADAFEAALEADCLALSAFELEPDGAWTVEGYALAEPDRGRLAARVALAAAGQGVAEPPLAISRIPPTDWLAETRQAFPPLRIGRFFVHGEHIGAGARPPATLPILVDAATAFGTGEHPSTAGCLRALERLAHHRRPVRALDMGCGTGILAIAMTRLWRCPVLAADIEAESVRVARFNAKRNGVAWQVKVVRSDGYRDAAIAAGGPYDLVVANILARPLAGMAAGLARSLAPGGTAILSGLLRYQEPLVLAAHRHAGLCLKERLVVAGWSTLILG
ncbi:MAG: methyltransferase domain-containing protein [Alphaproteobacteria bacterium]|jgi:ribosomal protein L11 methyltransferase|nr:methyltransferase domain-containing protein [Alphaproteobacteria bacterium]